jgi:DNA-binding transcriptional LysR family regulator
VLNGPRGKQSAVKPSSRLVINNAAMIRAMLQEGGGFALFPEFAVREALASGELVDPLPGWSVPDVAVHALFTERRTALANARAFVDQVVETVGNRRVAVSGG